MMPKISYLCVFEIASGRTRLKDGHPHYHLILFLDNKAANLITQSEMEYLWTHKQSSGHRNRFTHLKFNSNSQVARVKKAQPEHVNYVLKYIQKQLPTSHPDRDWETVAMT